MKRSEIKIRREQQLSKVAIYHAKKQLFHLNSVLAHLDILKVAQGDVTIYYGLRMESQLLFVQSASDVPFKAWMRQSCNNLLAMQSFLLFSVQEKEIVCIYIFQVIANKLRQNTHTYILYFICYIYLVFAFFYTSWIIQKYLSFSNDVFSTSLNKVIRGYFFLFT